MNRAIYVISTAINIFSIMCTGAYIAVAIEYGLDTTITAGIVCSIILAIITFCERRAIEQ